MEGTPHQGPVGLIELAYQEEQSDVLDGQIIALRHQVQVLLEDRQTLSWGAVEALVKLVELEEHPPVGRVQGKGPLETEPAPLRYPGAY